MSGSQTRPSLKGWHTFSEVASVLALAIGGLVTFGWIAGIRSLIHLLPVGVVMNPLTAVDCICAGAAATH